ncbi:MAG TPA: hypothetical protein VEZ14_10310, partial [Dehalococcoidia bacterium]|nr:hypothetical protein [Dehalococcoidia bacterium]
MSETDAVQKIHVVPSNGISSAYYAPFVRSDAEDSAILIGDSAEILRVLPDGLFQTCVTSPP